MLFPRNIGPITFSASGSGSREIPTDLPIREVRVDVYTELTNSSGGSLVDGQPFTLIRKARIVAGNGRVLADVTPKLFQYVNKGLNGAPFKVQKPSAAGAHSSTVVRFMFAIPFSDPKLRRAIESTLEHRTLGKLDIELDFGSASNLISGGTGTSIANTAIQVSAIYEKELPLQTELGPKGEVLRIGSDRAILATRAFIEKNEQTSAANTAYEFKLVPRNNIGRLWIFTESDDVLVDTVLNRLTLKSGQKIHAVLRDEELKDGNQGDLQLESIDAGVYCLNFLQDGMLSQALKAGREQSLELELDLNSPGTTEKTSVIVEELFTPPLHLLAA